MEDPILLSRIKRVDSFLDNDDLKRDGAWLRWRTGAVLRPTSTTKRERT
jgi:hypothetical protein